MDIKSIPPPEIFFKIYEMKKMVCVTIAIEENIPRYIALKHFHMEHS